jgi:hypothetical protein
MGRILVRRMKRIVAALFLCALPDILAMTLDEFAETTQNVVASGGFADYQPTAVFPARKEFRVLAGAPPDLTETKIVEWATKQAKGNEEFLVAFKVDSKHFKVVRYVGGKQTDSKVYAVR